MSKRDAKLLAQHWADNPEILARDLKTLIDWIEDTGLIVPLDAAALQRGARLAAPNMAEHVNQRLRPIESALHEYRRVMPRSRLNVDLLQPVTEAFAAAELNHEEVVIEDFSGIRNEVVAFQKWASLETQKMSSSPNRSELLKAAIEELGDEIIVRTDMNGSLKLRGSMSIPMFLALWKAPKHRLNLESFLDIDRRTNLINLERHRTRLCSRLQAVMLEVLADESSVWMQKCR